MSLRIGIKPGVKIGILTPQMVLAAMTVRDCYEIYGETECTITSGVDGQHMVGSLHYQGNALDFRLPKNGRNWSAIVDQIKSSLGGNYDVVKESTHIHVEYDPA